MEEAMSTSQIKEVTKDQFAAIRDSSLLLRIAGGIGSVVSAILVVADSLAWTSSIFSGASETTDVLGTAIAGHGARLVLFLFAFVAGAAIPALFKPARPRE